MRALAVLRLVEAASHHAARTRFPVAIDDQMGRELEALRREHPDPRDVALPILTDGRAALADLALDRASYVGHQLYDADLLTAAERTGRDGRARETWQLFLAGEMTVHVALEGDRIVAMRLRRAIPPPF